MPPPPSAKLKQLQGLVVRIREEVAPTIQDYSERQRLLSVAEDLSWELLDWDGARGTPNIDLEAMDNGYGKRCDKVLLANKGALKEILDVKTNTNETATSDKTAKVEQNPRAGLWAEFSAIFEALAKASQSAFTALKNRLSEIKEEPTATAAAANTASAAAATTATASAPDPKPEDDSSQTLGM